MKRNGWMDGGRALYKSSRAQEWTGADRQVHALPLASLSFHAALAENGNKISVQNLLEWKNPDPKKPANLPSRHRRRAAGRA